MLVLADVNPLRCMPLHVVCLQGGLAWPGMGWSAGRPAILYVNPSLQITKLLPGLVTPWSARELSRINWVAGWLVGWLAG